MAKPDDLPKHFEHGTRSRYIVGCRCASCTRANTEFMRMRTRKQIYGDWNGLVSTTKVKRHLKKLSRCGTGYKTVAKIAGVSHTVLAEAMSGRKKNIRARTERKVLAIGPGFLADHALVDATKTWEYLDALLQERIYTRQGLAKVLGSTAKTPSLQISKNKVLVVTARRVEELYKAMLT